MMTSQAAMAPASLITILALACAVLFVALVVVSVALYSVHDQAADERRATFLKTAWPSADDDAHIRTTKVGADFLDQTQAARERLGTMGAPFTWHPVGSPDTVGRLIVEYVVATDEQSPRSVAIAASLIESAIRSEPQHSKHHPAIYRGLTNAVIMAYGYPGFAHATTLHAAATIPTECYTSAFSAITAALGLIGFDMGTKAGGNPRPLADRRAWSNPEGLFALSVLCDLVSGAAHSAARTDVAAFIGQLHQRQQLSRDELRAVLASAKRLNLDTNDTRRALGMISLLDSLGGAS